MKKTISTGNTPKSASEFWCYIGPSVGGIISHGDIFPGGREDALQAAGAAIEQLPPVKTLLVSGERLAAAIGKVQEPGNALHAAWEQVRELARQRAKKQTEGAGRNA